MADEGFRRKLTAILSADVIGYSRLMRDNEEATVRDIAAHRVLISNIIQQHNGRVVDSPGDNILAEFASVVDAVNGAIKIQAEIKRSNADTEAERRMEFRIGINLGDVIEEEERIYGDGVNIAARVEGLASAGGIAISGTVYEHIKDKLSLGYHYLGEQDVKNIPEPVRVYRLLTEPDDAGKLIGIEKKASKKGWIWAAAAALIVAVVGIGIWHFYLRRPTVEPASVEKMAYPLPDKPSIAVLPFDNMSDDPEQAFFSDGLVEEIITALSSVPEFFVVARNSTFTYKGKPVKVQQISEELGVQYVLEGSVRKSGEKVRITAQLIDALKGHHLWAETYDRNIEDLFAVQEEITVKVITELREKITGSAQIRFAEPCSVNLEAYLKYLNALKHFYRFNRTDNATAKRLTEEAIALDPEYACAYSLLGGIHRMDVDLGSTSSPENTLATAKEMVDKAIDLNPSLAGPHGVLSHIYRTMGQYEKAIEVAEKAVALGPNNRIATGAMGMTLVYAGRSEESIPYFKKTIRIDPFSTGYVYFLGLAYFLTGQHEEAIQVCKALSDKTKSFMSYLLLAAAYSAAGREEEAHAAASEILEMNPKFTLERFSKSLRYKNPEDKELIISSLRKAGLPDKPPLPLPDKPSIAVLAFDNLSGDPEQEYFSDGLSENIITALSKVGELFVIARNSSFTYKGKPVKVQQIRRELGVRYVLEGSVQKSGDRVRITAQLIDAIKGQHIWAENYDRNLEDIFEIQDEITKKIVTGMRVNLTEGEQARLNEKQTENLDVLLKYAQFYALARDGTKESMMRRGEVAQEIIDIEPDNSLGYRLMGYYHRDLVDFGVSPKENLEKAFMFGKKALEMDESDGFAHALLGRIYSGIGKHEKAIESGKRSVELQPNGAVVHYFYAKTLDCAGHVDEAITYSRRAIRLNPFPAHYYYQALGRAYNNKGEHENALKEYKKALQRAPESPWSHFDLAYTYIFLGRDEEARASAAKCTELAPYITVGRVSKALSSCKMDKASFNKYLDAMRKAGFPE